MTQSNGPTERPRRALITGITGQDGGHLTELLLAEGYDVFGLVRGYNLAERAALAEEFPAVHLIEGDVTDPTSLIHALERSEPDELYNLAAITQVGYSFRNPRQTAEVTAVGALNVLEAVRTVGLEERTRILQAGSSEMFGGLDLKSAPEGFDEDSLFHPRSPYGVSKLFAYWIATTYRDSYGMFISSAIMFNHEGERRGREFVTRKITDGVARIHLGLADHIELGALWPKRDWGYAGDYARGIWQMLQHDEPDDFVLATGETHSIEEFLTLAFAEVGIDDWHPYVRQDPDLLRPAEVDVVLGNPAKAERVLGWKREISFPALVHRMVTYDVALHQLGSHLRALRSLATDS